MTARKRDIPPPAYCVDCGTPATSEGKGRPYSIKHMSYCKWFPKPVEVIESEPVIGHAVLPVEDKR